MSAAKSDMNHYLAASILKKAAEDAGISKKIFLKAIKLLSAEHDQQVVSATYRGTGSVPTTSISLGSKQSEKTSQSNKTKQSPPSANPLKKDPEYLSMVENHKSVISSLKEEKDSDEVNKLRQTLKQLETRMKSFLVSPKGVASGVKSGGSLTGSASSGVGIPTPSLSRALNPAWPEHLKRDALLNQAKVLLEKARYEPLENQTLVNKYYKDGYSFLLAVDKILIEQSKALKNRSENGESTKEMSGRFNGCVRLVNQIRAFHTDSSSSRNGEWI